MGFIRRVDGAHECVLPPLYDFDKMEYLLGVNSEWECDDCLLHYRIIDLGGARAWGRPFTRNENPEESR